MSKIRQGAHKFLSISSHKSDENCWLFFVCTPLHERPFLVHLLMWLQYLAILTSDALSHQYCCCVIKSNMFFFFFSRFIVSMHWVEQWCDKMASGQRFCKPIYVYIGAAMFALGSMYVCVCINVLNMKEYYCDIYQCALALYP